MGIYNRDGKWYVRYRSPVTGKVVRKSTGVSNKRLALDIDAKIRTEIAEKRFLGIVEPEDVLFDKLYDKYLKFRAKRVRPRTLARNKDSVKHLLKMFKGKLLSGIILKDIEDFVSMRLDKGKRDKPISKRTVNIDMMTLHAVLDKAIQWGHLLKNPAALVKKLPETPRSMQILTIEQEKKLFAELPYYTKPIVKMALLTGMRKGEVLNLKWSDILLEHRRIKIRGSKVQRERPIYITDTIMTLLRFLGPTTGDMCVFRKSNGKPFGDVRIGFKKACEKAGIPTFCFHYLRSTFAVRFLMGGGNLRALQFILGHRSLTTTERYLQITETQVSEEMDRFDKSTKKAQLVPEEMMELAKC